MILWSLSKQNCSFVAFAEVLYFLRGEKGVVEGENEER